MKLNGHFVESSQKILETSSELVKRKDGIYSKEYFHSHSELNEYLVELASSNFSCPDVCDEWAANWIEENSDCLIELLENF